MQRLVLGLTKVNYRTFSIKRNTLLLIKVIKTSILVVIINNIRIKIDNRIREYILISQQ